MKCLIICAILCCGALTQAMPQRDRQRQFPGGSNNNNQNPFFPPQNNNNINNNNNQNPFFSPQSNNNNNNNSQQPTGSTTPAPATVTTASPQYLDCLQSCPSTSEYNPICGSDAINYHNTGRLSCAQRCGKDVAMVRLGTCNPV